MANVPPAKRIPKKKSNPLRSGQNIDYKDTATLRKFISERGKIRARRVTGLSAGAAPGRHCHQERPRGCAAAVRLDGSLSQENDDMKLILTAAVDKLGLAGDVVEVKDGYGRNYLVPRGFAIRWTKGGEKQIDGIKLSRDAREIRGMDHANEIRTQPGRSDDRAAGTRRRDREAFGAVTPADVVAAIKKAAGPTVDKRSIEITRPIKSVGPHTVGVKLHDAVTAHIQLDVVRQT